MSTDSEENASRVLNVVADVLDDVREAVSGGEPKKLRIKFGKKTIAELPLALTAAGAIVIGLAAIALTKISVEIDRETK